MSKYECWIAIKTKKLMVIGYSDLTYTYYAPYDMLVEDYEFRSNKHGIHFSKILVF